jgi:hypothetical protein
MAQGEFTKEEAKATQDAFGEVMKAFPKSKVAEFFGHFNDIALFLSAAERAAPSESAAKLPAKAK